MKVIARASSKLEGLLELGVDPVFCDLADGDLPSNVMKGVDIVYHLAAVYRQDGVPQSYFYDVHVKGTARLLDASFRANVRRFVHCSTVGVQGDIQDPPATEMAPYNPGDEYQRSKMEGELCVLKFFREHSFPGVVVRPTGIYGPGDLRFLKLFRSIDRGWFIMLGKGDVLYHLTYVDDLTDGIILAGEREEAIGEIFTLGGKEYVEVRRIISMIAQILGKQTPRFSIPIWPVMQVAKICQRVCRLAGIEPPLYPRRLDFFTKDRAFDISKARRVLNYEPKTDLKTGLACTAEWYRQNNYL